MEINQSEKMSINYFHSTNSKLVFFNSCLYVEKGHKKLINILTNLNALEIAEWLVFTGSSFA